MRLQEIHNGSVVAIPADVEAACRTSPNVAGDAGGRVFPVHPRAA